MATAVLSKYKLIIPSEHGSWSLTLVPFIIGAGVAAATSAAPGAALGGLLCLLAVMGVFLSRQPVTLWLRIARGRGRRSHLPAARFWSLALLAAAGLAGLGLLSLGRWPVMWLALPAVGVLLLTAALTQLLGPRQLSTELIGVVGLALAAPAAYISVAGRIDALAWVLWALTAAHNVISILYVRLRIDERHNRATPQMAAWVIAAHVACLIATVGAALAGWLPALIALPVTALLLRAVFVAVRRPLVEDMKRFGFAEMGMGLAFAAVVILAFAL
ncbi:MAG TPA: YwiC-like family protein [Aggregatilineales bacterium]|nr:YwiC-like family protein [Aggregatilineales bacterium]